MYKYVDTPNFDILIFAYSADGGEVVAVDLTKESLSQNVLAALTDPAVTKIAYNAQFERVAIGKYLGTTLPPEQWRCTMVHAQEMGLPASLERCAAYLGVDEQKDTAGKNLIKFFSMPCKATKVNGGRTRNLPEHDPEKWQMYIDYCEQDVRTEMSVANILNDYPIVESEWDLYHLDQRMHDTGVGIDLDMADAAVAIDSEIRDELQAELKEVTGLANPNSIQQLKGWLSEMGHDFPTLGKAIVEAYVENGIVQGDVKKALELRLQLSNSSTKKYLMMQEATCSDGRIRGILQFYGANRTGRYAGRLIQVQNLPRNYMQTLDEARKIVKQRDRDGLEMIYDDVPDVLKQLIRTGIVAKEGHEFLVSDFAAIEARVLAWFASENWVIEAFREHGKIYEATAAQMFNLGPVLKYDWKSEEGKAMRQRGKVATLALGYQGGIGALKVMGALENGIEEDELQPLVDTWRKSNSKIVSFWYNTDKLVKKALDQGGVVRGEKGLKFFKKGEFLFIELPSGRRLSYARPEMQEGKYGPKITYEGQGTAAQFKREDTYGGKLVENIVQATARDLLAEALIRLEAEGYDIVFHVHDEVVCEAPTGERTIEEMNGIMAEIPEWAEGLPLGAEGFTTQYYMKD